MSGLSDEEKARIVFVENIGDDDDEATIRSQLRAYGNMYVNFNSNDNPLILFL
jgi:hypothetical protein